MKQTADSLVDMIVERLLTEDVEAPASVSRLAESYLNLSEQEVANSAGVLLSARISGPRWWREHLSVSRKHLQEDDTAQVAAALKPITDSANAAGNEAAFRQLLGRLHLLVKKTKLNVEADLESCADFLVALETPTVTDPLFHFSRFGEGLLQDLTVAEELCATAQRSDTTHAIDACSQLAGIVEDMVAGSRLVAALADDMNARINALTDSPSAE